MFQRKKPATNILHLDPDLFLVTQGAMAGFKAVMAWLNPASALVVFQVWKEGAAEPKLVCGHMNLAEKERDTTVPLRDEKGVVIRAGDELAWHTDQSLVTRDNVSVLVQTSGVKRRNVTEKSNITVFALSPHIGGTLVNYVRQVTCLTGITCTMDLVTSPSIVIDLKTGAHIIEPHQQSTILVPISSERLKFGWVCGKRDSQKEREKCQKRAGDAVARLVMDSSAQKPLCRIDLRYFWRRPEFAQLNGR